MEKGTRFLFAIGEIPLPLHRQKTRKRRKSLGKLFGKLVLVDRKKIAI